jgi:molecular chaperone DnaK (HSP70)
MRSIRYKLVVLLVALAVIGCSLSSLDYPSTIVESNSPAIGSSGVLEEAVGLETLGGVLTRLLNVGCRIPCASTETFSTASDNQERISIRLFRGDGTMSTDATPLGECRIEGIPPMPRGQPQIEVRLAAEGRNLVIEATDVGTRRPHRVVCIRSEGARG